MMARCAPGIALALLATGCAQSRPEVAPLQTVGPALPAGPGTPVPHLIDIGRALHTVETGCAPSPECLAEQGVGVATARCLPIAPEEGMLSAACRVDWFKGEPMRPGYEDHRGDCVRFILLDTEGAPGRKFWAVRYTPPGHKCEVPAQ